MTIQELIAELSKYDSQTPVVVSGYEAGYNDVSFIKPKIMQLNVNEQWHYGAQDCDKIVPDKPMVDVVYLGGYNPICDQPDQSYR